MTFSSLGLNQLILDAVNDQAYAKPTAIQEKAIPAILKGKNIVASSQTGSGKTAAFSLPLLDLLNQNKKAQEGKEPTRRAKRIRALILVPTRELALQASHNIEQYSKHLDIQSLAILGGADSEPQKHQLIDGVDIAVATPGRLLDFIHQRAIHFDELSYLVLDEADRMLDMGFIADINKIIDRLPANRQNLLFSATLSNDVRSLIKTAIGHAQEISIDKPSSKPQISQWLVATDKDTKSALLSHLIKEKKWTQALIFIRTKNGAAKLVSQLEKRGIQAESIHSGKSQASRIKILSEFKSGEIAYLIATGIAARGIDVDNLERVINYDLPDDAEEYIHRIGRTGRAGTSGEAISLVSKDDFKRLCAIEKLQQKIIERKEIEGFEVKKPLPVSNLNYVKKHRENSHNSEAKNSPRKQNPHK